MSRRALLLLLSSSGYAIAWALRVNPNDAPRLTLTYGAVSRVSATEWTYSVWFKRSQAGAGNFFMQARTDDNNRSWINVTGNNTVSVYDRTAGVDDFFLETDAIIRDPCAVYHLCVTFDSNNATAGDRCRIYLNGTRMSTTGSNPSLGEATRILNEAIDHSVISRNFGGSWGLEWDGYVAEMIAVDGQALSPSDFGRTDPSTGEWVPKQYTGTFGNTGFYLNFANSGDLGADASGNGNHFTEFGLAANDQMPDTPTLNYPTFNPVASLIGTSATFREGNTEVVARSSNLVGTMAVSSGKWNWEFKLDQVGTNQDTRFGIRSLEGAVDGGFGLSILYEDNGQKLFDGSATAYGSAFAAGDVVDVVLDLDAATPFVEFYKNGVAQGALNLSNSAGVGPWAPIAMVNNNTTNGIVTLRSGARGELTPASGYSELNSKNLPVPAVKNPRKFFKPVLYTGDGTAIASGGKVITGVGFSPDLVWFKNRDDGTAGHSLFDTARGTTLRVSSNSTQAEDTLTEGLDSFDADGMTVGEHSTVNAVGDRYVAWCFKKLAGFFDIATYLGNGSARTVAHNLGVAPELIIVKSRSIIDDWVVGHAGLNSGAWTHNLVLNNSNAASNALGAWNNTAPTSSVFTVNSTDVNQNGVTYLAYLFASLDGLSKVGSYTGNGSADGPFVYTGFRPALLLVKNADNGAVGWVICDSARSTYNVVDDELYPHSNIAEVVAGGVDFLSNGFKMRNTSTARNASGANHVYLAIAESPFKYARAR